MNELFQQVPSIPRALAALDGLRKELTAAKTYDQLRRVVREAEAIRVLAGHVEEIKHRAEDTILAAQLRIAEEIKRVPKKTGRKSPAAGDSPGREDLTIPSQVRSRLLRLAEAPAERVELAKGLLRSAGKDVTVHGVLGLLGGEHKAARRSDRLTRAATRALPGGLFPVVLADPPWRFETWSEAGKDRHPENHYPTMATDEICELAIPAARDAVLFLWATAPMLEDAMRVVRAWRFTYRSFLAWDKQVDGTAIWVRSRVELLLIATRGDIPAPLRGEALPGMLSVRRSTHSTKPEEIYTEIERLFPLVPKLELFARRARPGWEVWGDEAPSPAGGESRPAKEGAP